MYEPFNISFYRKNILGEKKGGASEIHLRKANRFRSELRIYLYNI